MRPCRAQIMRGAGDSRYPTLPIAAREGCAAQGPRVTNIQEAMKGAMLEWPPDRKKKGR